MEGAEQHVFPPPEGAKRVDAPPPRLPRHARCSHSAPSVALARGCSGGEGGGGAGWEGGVGVRRWARAFMLALALITLSTKVARLNEAMNTLTTPRGGSMHTAARQPHVLGNPSKGDTGAWPSGPGKLHNHALLNPHSNHSLTSHNTTGVPAGIGAMSVEPGKSL